MVKVSVIIPTYNCAVRLRGAIDSVLNQSYQDFEIVVVDDGSTDNTKETVKSISRQYPNKINYVYQENAGPAAARNRGLQIANGEYIAFLDADDIWLPLKIERQVALLERLPETGFVYCNCHFVDSEGREIPDYVRKVTLHRGDVLLDLFLDFFIITSGLIFRNGCLKTVGLFDEALHVGEDYDFILRLAKHYKAEVVEEKLWNRVVRPDSLSRQDFALDARTDLTILARFLRQNPEFYRSHKGLVDNRLSTYYFSFGYSLLEQGHNGGAFNNFLNAFRYHPSVKAAKNMLLCVVPLFLRKALKKSIRRIARI